MRLLMTLAAVLSLAGCAGQRSSEPVPRAPAEVKAEIVRLMPAKVADDGQADLRLDACLTTDSGIGVVRHAKPVTQWPKPFPKGKGR